MPFCAYIPKATLAAVIITAVIFIIKYEVVLPLWHSNRIELIPGFVTFFCCVLWNLEYGILVGIGVTFIFILYNAARPNVHMETHLTDCGKKYLWVSTDQALTFTSINYVRNMINKAAVEQTVAASPVVIDCSLISSIDFTAGKGISSMILDFKTRGQGLFFYNAQKSVQETLDGGSVKCKIVRSSEELSNCLQA